MRIFGKNRGRPYLENIHGIFSVKALRIQDMGEGGLLMASSGDQLSLWARELVAASRSDWPQRWDSSMSDSFIVASASWACLFASRKTACVRFSRHDGRFALTIEPASVTHPDGGLINIGVPFGPKLASSRCGWRPIFKPRRNTTDRVPELKGITDWLEARHPCPWRCHRLDSRDKRPIHEVGILDLHDEYYGLNRRAFQTRITYRIRDFLR